MEVASFPDIERAVQFAEYVLAGSDKTPAFFVKPHPSTTGKSKSIHQKLMDLYLEESMKEPDHQEVLYASNLLAKLAKRERLNCMVISLYPGNEGYSVMLKSRSGVESETMKLPYEESEILECVNAAQLPPFLLDLLEKAQVNVFYSGCVVVELRDYRRSTTGSHDSQYVLLRPSPQSLLRDITALSCDGHSWSQDDLFCLESELILATEEPLCLNPSPAVMFVENAIQYEEKCLNNPALKGCIRRYTQAALNRKRKLGQAPAPKGMQLHDFLVKKREKTPKIPPLTGLGKARLVIDNFKVKTQPQLATPEVIDVKKFVKLPEVPSASGMIFVEEHTMERDPMLERHMLAKITIYQPQLGDHFCGEFYLDHDYTPSRAGEEGRRCRFVIGSRQCVDRYLQQFKDLFTEEGKLQVKIAVLKANEPAPTIFYTQGVAAAAAQNSVAPTTITISSAQALMKQVASSQQQMKAADMSTVANLAAKRNIPIQLSLSISPAVCLSSAQAGILAQANAVGIPSSLSAQFIASTVPSGSLMTAQRIKTPLSSQQRLSSSPLTSPAVIAKVSTSQQLTQPTSASLVAVPKVATIQTPPTTARTPTPTPTPTSTMSRRSSATELTLPATSTTGQQQQPNLASFLQSESQGSGSNHITNINLTSLPPNLNIQGLTSLPPGVNITNLSGLQQMQIALPVPITLINNNPSLLQANTGLLATAASTAATSATTFVTMVTALQAAASSNSTTSSTATTAHQTPSSTAKSSCTSTMIPQGSGMLSFGLGSLTQLMPVSSKSQGSASLRTSTGTVPLLQLQGQQGPIQLLSVQQQRGPVRSGALTASTVTQGGARPTSSAVPLSTVLTGPVTALTVGGKPGQATSNSTITPHQLLQLTGGTATSLGPATSQLTTHVAFQKGQAAGQQMLQFHSLQLKPGSSSLTSQSQGGAKNKSKKRTTPTPPK